ncbi:MAG: hypothetical protein Q9221_002522 [Calogaya cf. arnoldii]
MPSSRPPLGFLSLPRELRDIIYRLYVFEPEGYPYDYESRKLRAHGNRHIDLALMRTCSVVAAEMHHLPLGINVLHFYTSTPEVDAKLALRYPEFAPLLRLPYDKSMQPGPYFSDCADVASSWGEADSLFIAFRTYMIELLSTDTDFRDALFNFYENDYAMTKLPDDFDTYVSRLSESCEDGELAELRAECEAARDEFEEQRLKTIQENQQFGREQASLLRHVLSMSSPEPWMIPSDDELAQMNTSAGYSATKLEGTTTQTFLHLWHIDDAEGAPLWNRGRWRFSAAAAAIRFLISVSQTTCLKVRRIVLHEDRPSVARPESHALGLIPFCVHNPQLNNERRVSVWGALFTSRPLPNHEAVYRRVDDIVTYSNDDDEDRRLKQGFCTSYIVKSFCRWITEASALSANGMPDNTFSLVFDGDPAPDQCSDLFEIVKDDAAWQVARTQWYNDLSLSPSMFEKSCGGIHRSGRKRGQAVYYSRVFPQSIDEIVKGESFISCNFPTGSPYNHQRVLDATQYIIHYSTDFRLGHEHRWLMEWLRRHLRHPFQLSPPLPSFCELMLQDQIPVEQHTASPILSFGELTVEDVISEDQPDVA